MDNVKIISAAEARSMARKKEESKAEAGRNSAYAKAQEYANEFILGLNDMIETAAMKGASLEVSLAEEDCPGTDPELVMGVISARIMAESDLTVRRDEDNRSTIVISWGESEEDIKSRVEEVWQKGSDEVVDFTHTLLSEALSRLEAHRNKRQR